LCKRIGIKGNQMETKMDFFSSGPDIFVQKYQGKRLSIASAGAGVSFTDILRKPGASKFVSGIYLPYGIDETKEFITQNIGYENGEKFGEKAVCKESAELLYRSLKIRNAVISDIENVAITAAIQTNRHRRGENQAFIAIENQTWNLKLRKLTENDFSYVAEMKEKQVIGVEFNYQTDGLEHKISYCREENDYQIFCVVSCLLDSNMRESYSREYEKWVKDGTLTRV
jgi:hypothetical protein